MLRLGLHFVIVLFPPFQGERRIRYMVTSTWYKSVECVQRGIMTYAQIRLRHPRGVTTLDVDPEYQTIDDLKVLIFSASEISPAEQESMSVYHHDDLRL